MTCKDCSFCYRTEDNKYPTCQFRRLTCWDVPPCEQEEIDRQREIDEMEWEREKEQINDGYTY